MLVALVADPSTDNAASARPTRSMPVPEDVPEVIDPVDEHARESLLAQFHPLFSGSGGIDSWLRGGTPRTVVERLEQLGDTALTREQLNQLLVLSHEASMSKGFFEYYWLTIPDHTYAVTGVGDFDRTYAGRTTIESLQHLRWGLSVDLLRGNKGELW
jgi:hypothetical protein